CGGELYIVDNDSKRDPDKLIDVICMNRIKLVIMPFSALNLLFYRDIENERIVSLQHLITSGEQLIITQKINKALKQNPELKLHNQYGPTETHVVTSKTLSGEQQDLTPTIGHPIENTIIRIENPKGDALPIGKEGE